MSTTRAALFWGTEADRMWSIEEVTLDPLDDDSVAVRMVALGICGSDLHVVRGEWQRPLPMILGHEGAGVVEAVGDAVESPRVGDRVVLSWGAGCGDCADCRRNRPATCATLREAIASGTLLNGTTGVSFDGEPVYRMTALGALSELVVVPAAAAITVPDDFPFDEAALLGCAAMTGVGAVLNAADPVDGATMMVVGVGGVGQFALQGARIAKAAEIVAVDPSPERRAQAMQFGATRAVAPEDALQAVHEVAPHGVDFAFEAVGLPDAQELALRATRQGGKTVLVGMTAAGQRLSLEPQEFTNREKILTGSLYGSGDPSTELDGLVTRTRAGELELRQLIGPTFPLERIEEAFAASLSSTEGRVLIDFGQD